MQGIWFLFAVVAVYKLVFDPFDCPEKAIIGIIGSVLLIEICPDDILFLVLAFKP